MEKNNTTPIPLPETESSEESLIKFRTSNHPVMQANFWGVPALYPWQQAIWDACWGFGRQVAVRTCNESGKTSLIVPALAMSFASAFPGSKVVITSASQRQIDKQLWDSLENLIANKPGYSKAGNTIRCPSHEGLPASQVIAFATSSGDLFEGYHNKLYGDDQNRTRYSPLMVIIDEAKSVDESIWTAVERCNPVVQLVISTTGEDNGPFFNACMNSSGLWITEWEWRGETYPFRIPWTMCPHLLRGHTHKRKAAMIADEGQDSPRVASILMAEFFRGGTQMVFNEYDLQRVLHAQSGQISTYGTERRAACDFAAGGDELVFCVRDGNRVHPMVGWNVTTKTPPTEIAGTFVQLFKKWDLMPEQISADNGGIGALIINEIEKMGYEGIFRYNANGKPRDKKQFVNQYAEDMWTVRTMVHEGQLSLDRDEVLYEQCRLRRFSIRNSDDNAIRLEPKKESKIQRGESSPDRLDALLMCTRDLQALTVDAQETRQMICPTPKELVSSLEEEESGHVMGGGWGGDVY